MGKVKARNAFFYYLLHTQSSLKSEGKYLHLNDSELQRIAGQNWQNLSPEERKPFEDKSKAEKEKANEKVIEIRPKTYADRQNQANFGRVLSEECQQIDDECSREEYLDKIIKCCVKSYKTREELMNASFFIVATNVMIKTDNNEFLPLEIGICQYSIKDGIQLTYHKFIDPGPIPIGYAFMAKDHAEVSHKIPLQSFSLASAQYQKIVEEIVEILAKSRFTNEINNSPTPMLVFCREDAIPQNKGVFEWLAKKYRSTVPSFNWDLEVLDLVYLLFHISNAVNQKISLAVGEDYLTSSAFDYSPDTNCPFHEEQENPHCAQGLARRLCYMLSQQLCKIFEINPTENHLPPKRKNVVTETYSQTFRDYKPLPSRRYHDSGQSSTSNNDWAPLPPQQRPESSATNRPQSRTSGQFNRLGIGRGRSLPPRTDNYSSGQ